jgi:mRNA interferase RelE/StbE
VAYRIELRPAAVRELKALPRRIQTSIKGRIDALADDPRPRGVKKLSDEDLYRIRVGNYRVIYQIRDKVLLVVVVKVGHRREVYRK